MLVPVLLLRTIYGPGGQPDAALRSGRDPTSRTGSLPSPAGKVIVIVGDGDSRPDDRREL
jgi:hypothetical protein